LNCTNGSSVALKVLGTFSSAPWRPCFHLSLTKLLARCGVTWPFPFSSVPSLHNGWAQTASSLLLPVAVERGCLPLWG
jgi:hypothetical protein